MTMLRRNTVSPVPRLTPARQAQKQMARSILVKYLHMLEAQSDRNISLASGREEVNVWAVQKIELALGRGLV